MYDDDPTYVQDRDLTYCNRCGAKTGTSGVDSVFPDDVTPGHRHYIDGATAHDQFHAWLDSLAAAVGHPAFTTTTEED